MSNFKLEYKLIQQTPLIHFQHDQSGATLRASEVKPKLDKFIIKKLGGIEALLNDEHLSWFIEQPPKKDGKYIAPEHIALNYKMRIVANGDAIVSEYKKYAIMAMNSQNSGSKKEYNKKAKKEINGMYFGNQGNKPEDLEHYKETVFYKEPIDLFIVCGIEELKNVIDEYIAEFFTVTNFGTRQTKGFGGFLLKKYEKNDWVPPIDEKNVINILINKNYNIFYADQLKNTQNPMDVARSIYCCLKTGVNMGLDKRVKGFILYKYLLCNKDLYKGRYYSDKSLMSEKLINKDTAIGKKYLFVRALLGLTDVYDYKFQGKKVTVKCLDKEKENGKEVVSVERFPSPITIKIIGREVIFIFNAELYEYIRGKNFELECEGRNRKESISVPEEFNVKQFIKDFIDYYNSADDDEFLPKNIDNVPGFNNTYVKISNERRDNRK